MKLANIFQSSKITRILFGSDFHGSDIVYRKFLAAAFQYNADVLVVGGDVTGKAMIPVIHQGNGVYQSTLFGKETISSTPDEINKVKKDIANVGFYPILIEKDEATELENSPEKMATRFEHEMCERIREWMKLAEEKIIPKNKSMYFMAGNDDLSSIDETIAEFEHIHNPDMASFDIEGGYEIVGCSYANMTPWHCARDLEEEELSVKLNELAGKIRHPESCIAVLHVPPYQSGLDSCPDLDKNLKLITQGGQVVMKSAGSTAAKAWLEGVQPMLSLHGHIHESPGHIRIGRTLAINAGSEYAEAIMKAAIINLEGGNVKGHMLISG